MECTEVRGAEGTGERLEVRINALEEERGEQDAVIQGLLTILGVTAEKAAGGRRGWW